jgi:hypothetical protein
MMVDKKHSSRPGFPLKLSGSETVIRYGSVLVVTKVGEMLH